MNLRVLPIPSLASICSIVVIGWSGCLLAGWCGGYWQKDLFGLGGALMQPFSALGLLLLAVGSLVQASATRSKLASLPKGIAWVVALLAIAFLITRYLEIDGLLEQWLLGRAGNAEILISRMPVETAVVFLLAAVALAAANPGPAAGTGARWTTPVLGILIGIIGLGMLAAAMAGAATPMFGNHAAMAWQTALGLIGLSGALVSLRVDTFNSLVFGNTEALAGKRRWLLPVSFLAAAIGMNSVGVALLRPGNSEAREEALSALAMVAQTKVARVAQWRHDHLALGEVIRRSPAQVDALRRWLADPADHGAPSGVEDWLNALRDNGDYRRFLVFRPGLQRVPVRSGEAETEPSDEILRNVAEAFRSGKVGFCDLHLERGTARTLAAVVIPLPAESGTVVAGVVVMEIEADQFLFPMLQSLANERRSGEVVLLEMRDGDFLVMNDLRFQAGAALKLRHPVLPAVAGRATSWQGQDYRGVPVLAVIQPVPPTSWWLVAKIDEVEAMAAFARRGRTMLFTIAALTAALGAGIGLLGRRTRESLIRRERELEEERALLWERLDVITRQANDIVMVLNPDGRIIDANERALAAYGYSLAELSALEPGGLLAPAVGPGAPARERLLVGDGPREMWHRRRNGSMFPVEVNGWPITVGGRAYHLGIFRDITERKAHEREIEQLNELYRALSRVNQAVVHSRTQQVVCDEVCKGLVEISGVSLVWIGEHDEVSRRLVPMAVAGTAAARPLLDVLDLSTAGAGGEPCLAVSAFLNGRVVLLDEGTGERDCEARRVHLQRFNVKSAVAQPIHRAGKIWGSLTVYSAEKDVFRKKETELLREVASDLSFALDLLDRAERERQLQVHYKNLADIVAASDDAIVGRTIDGVVSSWNPGAERLYGYTAREVIGQRVETLVPPAQMEELRQANEKLLRGETVPTFETVRQCRDGREIAIAVTLSPVRDREGRVTGVATIARDITTRREAAESLRQSEQLLREAQAVAQLGSYRYEVATDTWIGSAELSRILGIADDHPRTLAGWLSLVIPTQREEVRDHLVRQVLAEGNRFDREFRIIRPGDQQERWLFGLGEVERDARGRALRMTGTFQDITVRK